METLFLGVLPKASFLARDGGNQVCGSMSKSQLNAFMVKVGANAGLKTKVDAAISADDVVALALEEGHLFSAATWTRLQRG